MDPLPIIFLIAITPLLIAIYIRYALSPARRGVHTELDAIHLGPSLWFWLIGLLSLVFLPSLLELKSGNITLFPRLFPSDPSGFGSFTPVTFGLVIAWIAAWFFGAPLAALAGVRAGLVLTIVLCSAGIITNHLALALPDAHDELVILAIGCVQCVLCLSYAKREHLAASTNCSKCGYDLSNSPEAATPPPCPECGTPHAIATTTYTRQITLSKRAPRIAMSWAVAAIIAMFAPPVGMLTVMVSYLSRGIEFNTAVQLAQQYEGNTGSPLLHAWPLPVAGMIASLLYQYFGSRRKWLLVWLLIPLGVAASFALRLFV